MSSHGIPPSSSKNPNPSSSLKPKPQPPKEYVQMRNERFQENKEILRDGLTPVDRVRSEQQMSSHGIPPSSSKNPNPSSSLKPKPQPPKEYVQMRNERLQENKEILRDGLTPVDRVRSEQQFGTKQKLNEINPKNKP
ncbi:hypothetical protein QTP88_010487 [Uroleucon formosanum]